MNDWPTLDQLEPIANWLAMRFAQSNVSMAKIQQLSSTLHYHCLEHRREGMVINFGLLGAWLWREKGDFKDGDAVDVLCALLRQYANCFKGLKDEAAKLALYRSLTHLLTLLTWKFKVFSDKEKGQALRESLAQYAEAVKEINEKIRNLKDMKPKDDFTGLCRDIEEALEGKTGELPFAARLAIGL